MLLTRCDWELAGGTANKLPYRSTEAAGADWAAAAVAAGAELLAGAG